MYLNMSKLIEIFRRIYIKLENVTAMKYTKTFKSFLNSHF